MCSYPLFTFHSILANLSALCLNWSTSSLACWDTLLLIKQVCKTLVHSVCVWIYIYIYIIIYYTYVCMYIATVCVNISLSPLFLGIRFPPLTGKLSNKINLFKFKDDSSIPT